MIKEANGYGLTIDEAKEKALSNLNVSDMDDVQFDVVSIPKKKVLGIFGGTQAQVRAYIEVPDKKPAAKKTAERKPAENKTSAPRPKTNKSSKPEKEAAPVSAKVEKPVSKPAVKPEPKKPIRDIPDYSEPVDAATLDKDSNAAKAVEYIKAILASLDCGEVSIKVASRENASLITLDGEDLSILIGRRGETLDAIQYLASLASNNGGGHYKISINIGSYREKREETLKALAKRLADQALKAGKCRTLEPMNPYERRIIHTAIQEIDGVESASFGEGVDRRVVIAPTGVEMHPRMNYNRNGSFRGNNNRSGRRPGGNRGPRPQAAAAPSTDASREPKRDTDIPLYGKIK